jgi:hypothetical protein
LSRSLSVSLARSAFNPIAKKNPFLGSQITIVPNG